MGKRYAGNIPVKDHRVSPLFGDFSDVGHITLFQGAHDLLLADARNFFATAKERGIPVDYYEYPMMNHVFPLLPVSEAADALEKIASAINRRS